MGNQKTIQEELIDQAVDRVVDKFMRLHRPRKTLAEEIEFEREFGDEIAGGAGGLSWHEKPALWRERWKSEANRFGVTYDEVKAAYLKLWAEQGKK